MVVADPWYDYLALPIAPIVLFLQFGTLFVPTKWLRWSLTVCCFGAVLAMEQYVADLPHETEPGAPIGLALLYGWLGCSVLLLAAAFTREVVEMAHRRWRATHPD